MNITPHAVGQPPHLLRQSIPPESHEWRLRAIEIQGRAEIVFGMIRRGACSPDLLFTSLRLLSPPEREVFCREIQKQIEQAKK